MPLHAIEPKLIAEIVSEYDNLNSLNLSHNLIRTIQSLEPLTTLEELNLSHNYITIVHPVAFITLSKLLQLNLAHNQISELPDFPTTILPNLRLLDISFNCIQQFQSFQHLNSLQSLQQLQAEGNPVSTLDNYRQQIVTYLPRLTILDNREILSGERPVPHQMNQGQKSATNGSTLHKQPKTITDSRIVSATPIAATKNSLAMHKLEQSRLPSGTENSRIASTHTVHDMEQLKIDDLNVQPLGKAKDTLGDDEFSQSKKSEWDSRNLEPQRIHLLTERVAAMETIVKLQEEELSKEASSEKVALTRLIQDDPAHNYKKLLETWRKKVFELLLDAQACRLHLNTQQRSFNEQRSKLEANFAQQTKQLDLMKQRLEDSEAKYQLEQVEKEALAEERGRAESKAAKIFERLQREKDNLAQLASTVVKLFQSEKSQYQVNRFNHSIQRLNSYEQRLSLMYERLQTLACMMKWKQVQFRNGEAALEAERRVWISRLQKYEANVAEDKQEDLGSSRVSTTSVSSIKGLHPECEAAMRSIFNRMDYYGTGLVNHRQFLQVLEDDTTVAGAICRRHGGKSSWEYMIAGLKEQAKQKTPEYCITWGEFLLAFIPEIVDSPGCEAGSEHYSDELPPPFSTSKAEDEATEARHELLCSMTISRLNFEQLDHEHLLEEAKRLAKERRLLALRVKEDASAFRKRVTHVQDQWKDKVQCLVENAARLKEEIIQSKNVISSQEEMLREEKKTIAEYGATKSRLQEELDTLKYTYAKEKAMLQDEMDRKYSALERDSTLQNQELEDQVSNLKRENAKQSVMIRQIERQLARQKEKNSEEERSKFEYLEERISKRDVEIAKLRRERNALLTTLREQERKHMSKSLAKEDTRSGSLRSSKTKSQEDDSVTQLDATIPVEEPSRTTLLDTREEETHTLNNSASESVAMQLDDLSNLTNELLKF